MRGIRWARPSLLAVGAALLLLGASGGVALRAQTPDHPAPGPYAGQQDSAVRGLSEAEINAFRNGMGIGLARAADVNGYPGPLHVIDLAEALALTPSQHAAVTVLMSQARAEASAKGEEFLARYALLEQAFRDETITLASLDAYTAALGRIEGELRAIHLKYHLLTRDLLTDAQLATYARLRGYTSDTPPPAHGPGMAH
jgi:hypothetical protein